jgi:hypothetical protein
MKRAAGPGDSRQRWLRGLGAIWIIAFLIWLPFEDTETWMVIALAAGGCAWIGLRWVTRRASSPTWPANLAASALLGAIVPIFAIVLMAFKGGLHAHGFADFTARQVWEVLSLIPVSAILGGAAGWVTWVVTRRWE